MFSLVIPTYNEKNNIVSLIEKIRSVFSQPDYEVIVVDDNSPDETWRIVEELSPHDAKIRVIRRLNERGLSSAVLEGFRQAKGNILGVMDADHSHDVRLLPQMAALIEQGKADCVVGSRRIAGGGADKWPWYRRFFSNFATLSARVMTGVRVSDPMSGFFAISRNVFEAGATFFEPRGYKIFLEIVAKAKPGKIVELPYIFVDRKQGYSKLSFGVLWAFGLQLVDLLFWSIQNKQKK